MPGLPVMLNLHGHKCLIVGGGAVALRRAHALAAAGCSLITVVAPHIDPALRELHLTIHQRPVRETDLVDVRLVVLATDDHHLNERIARQAAAMGVLINRADDAVRSEINFMAQAHIGPVTIAAHTGNAMPDAARAIISELCESLNKHWPVMIEIAAPFRQSIKQTISDQVVRRATIARLTDSDALAVFLSQGSDGYRAYCEAVARMESSTVSDTKVVPENPLALSDPLTSRSNEEVEGDDFSINTTAPA